MASSGVLSQINDSEILSFVVILTRKSFYNFEINVKDKLMYYDIYQLIFEKINLLIMLINISTLPQKRIVKLYFIMVDLYLLVICPEF